jgi:hypothetical protein
VESNSPSPLQLISVFFSGEIDRRSGEASLLPVDNPNAIGRLVVWHVARVFAMLVSPVDIRQCLRFKHCQPRGYSPGLFYPGFCSPQFLQISPEAQ